MQHANDSANTRAHTTATTTEAVTPTRNELQTDFVCLFLSLSEPNKALLMRLVRAVIAKDAEALEALKADSPPDSIPVIDGLIADIQGVQS